MKLLLVGLNAKYSHTALAVYQISAFLNSKGFDNEIAEYTINDSYESIFYDIIEKSPEIIGFSTYIWNIILTKRLISDLKKAIPNIKIILGGPEAGYSNEFYENADKIITGEGEAALYNYLTGSNESIEFSDLPFPYRKPFPAFKTAYYESSRGCPYRCSYCISSLEKNLRFKPLEKVKQELKYFLDNKVNKVKFIDRTFNINENTFEIFEFIINNYNGNTSFHFEIKPELFDERMLELLKTSPIGLIQFEAGIQSLNENTLKAINRNNKIDKAFYNLSKIIENNNIRTHLDLICGLPYENKESFICGFNKVYSIKPHILQLGFLKLLNGTQIKEQICEHEIEYSSYPPYQVIKTKYLSVNDIIELKTCEDGLDTFSNKGFFTKSLEFVFNYNAIEPYAFFKYCGEQIKNKPPLSHPNLFSMFYEIYLSLKLNNSNSFLELLILDYKEKNPNKPLFKIIT